MVDQTHRAATMKTANQTLNRYADEPDEPVQTVPMMIDGGLLRGQVVVVISQCVVALGALIGFFGFAEQSWIVKLYRFTQAEAAVPVLALLATGITTIIMVIRNRRKKIQRTVLAALAPNTVAQVTGKISAPIQLAIDDAIVAQHAVEPIDPDKIRALDQRAMAIKRYPNDPKYDALCDEWSRRPDDQILVGLPDFLRSRGWDWNGTKWAEVNPNPAPDYVQRGQ